MSSIVIDLNAASTGELVNAAVVIAGELAQRSAPESAAVCMELTETLAGATDLHESALSALIAVVDASGEMRRWGFPSTRVWLRSRLGMREVRAKERVTLARQRERLPTTAELLARGELAHGYASTIADSVVRLDDHDCTAAENILLEKVGEGFSAGKVAAFGRRIRDVVAERDGADRPPEDAERGYGLSWISSTRSLDGGRYIKGWLNAEDAAIWDGTLGPLAKPAGTDDRRDLSERAAAALTSVLSGGHKATKVTVIVDLDTLTGGCAPARLTDGSPIPAEQARRIALATGVTPLLFGRGHVPLYWGTDPASPASANVRRSRRFTPHAPSRDARYPARCVRSITWTAGRWAAVPPMSTGSPCVAAGTTASSTPTPSRCASAEAPMAGTSTVCSPHRTPRR